MRIRESLRRFWQETEANLTVETILVLPILLWAFFATFVFFDAFRAKSLAIKGNYAVADLLSRETQAIDMDYLRGTGKVYEFLTQSGTDSWLRVTPVRCIRRCNNETTRVLRRDWSRATDGVQRLTNTDLNTTYRSQIPLIARGERVIIVETRMHYTPPIAANIAGVTERDLYDITMTRPRFAPQLCWVGRYCGNS